MVGLRPKLLSELRPGSRIVSHDYHYREWLPDSRVTFDVPEKKESVGFSQTSIFLWIVPAAVGGRWSLEVPGVKPAGPVTLELHQLFQNVNGAARVGARKTELANVKLRADSIEFSLDTGSSAGGDRQGYRGKVFGDSMQGEVVWTEGGVAKRTAWKATRIGPAETPLAH
jgi:hypothetical protein